MKRFKNRDEKYRIMELGWILSCEFYERRWFEMRQMWVHGWVCEHSLWIKKKILVASQMLLHIIAEWWQFIGCIYPWLLKTHIFNLFCMQDAYKNCMGSCNKYIYILRHAFYYPVVPKPTNSMCVFRGDLVIGMESADHNSTNISWNTKCRNWESVNP